MLLLLNLLVQYMAFFQELKEIIKLGIQEILHCLFKDSIQVFKESEFVKRARWVYTAFVRFSLLDSTFGYSFRAFASTWLALDVCIFIFNLTPLYLKKA